MKTTTGPNAIKKEEEVEKKRKNEHLIYRPTFLVTYGVEVCEGDTVKVAICDSLQSSAVNDLLSAGLCWAS